jgi:hypothetical protein
MRADASHKSNRYAKSIFQGSLLRESVFRHDDGAVDTTKAGFDTTTKAPPGRRFCGMLFAVRTMHRKGKAMAQPIKVSICNIRFEEGKLWQPRYDSLINYSHAPKGFQFEPSFTLCTAKEGEPAEVEVLFAILPTENVVFDVLNGAVRWEPVSGRIDPSAVAVAVVDKEHQVCRVTWRRDGTFLTALRICCRHKDAPPPQDDSAWSLIEGGVYLVIIDPGQELPKLPPAQKDAGEPRRQRVRLLGIDEHCRPVYDLFCGNVPPELLAEPAFRAGHGESLDLSVALDLPKSYEGAQFKTDDQGQASIFFAVPLDTRPPSLMDATVGEEGKECTFQWKRRKHVPASQTVGSSYQWSISNFYAELRLGNTYGDNKVLVDPTVIEPPACDAGSGVCGPPRERWEPA